MDYHHCWAFGCSYTAGAELLDHLVHEDADRIKATQGLSHWLQHHRPAGSPLDKELTAGENQLSWAAHVAQKLGLGFTNRALGGSSLAHTVWSIEQAMYSNQIDQHSLVLVGVTTMHRGLHWHSDNATMSNWLLSNLRKDSGAELLSKLSKIKKTTKVRDLPNAWNLVLRDEHPSSQWHWHTVNDIMNDSQCLWLHLGYVLRLIELSRRCHMHIFTMHGLDNIVLDEQKRGVDFTDRYTEITQCQQIHFQRNLLDFIDSPDQRHGAHHPRDVVHRRFANWVFAELA